MQAGYEIDIPSGIYETEICDWLDKKIFAFHECFHSLPFLKPIKIAMSIVLGIDLYVNNCRWWNIYTNL